MQLEHYLTFASEAEWVGVWGVCFIVAALFAGWQERRRLKRRSIDKVGWVPWLSLCLFCTVIGGGMIVLAVKGIAAG